MRNGAGTVRTVPVILRGPGRPSVHRPDAGKRRQEWQWMDPHASQSARSSPAHGGWSHDQAPPRRQTGGPCRSSGGWGQLPITTSTSPWRQVGGESASGRQGQDSNSGNGAWPDARHQLGGRAAQMGRLAATRRCGASCAGQTPRASENSASAERAGSAAGSTHAQAASVDHCWRPIDQQRVARQVAQALERGRQPPAGACPERTAASDTLAVQ